jgi:hypothetical protein
MAKKTYLDWEAIGRTRRWLDYGLLCMYESAAAIVVGADTFEFSLGTLTWDAFEVVSPISGESITVSGGSTSASDGDIIFIRNVEHPFKSESKSISVGAASDKATRKPTNLFLGAISGGSVHILPAGGGSVVMPSFTEYDFIPIEWSQDGGTPPAVPEDVVSGNGTLKVRKFDNTVANDVVFPWEVPDDIVVADGIRFQVMGVFADAGMSGQGLAFGLKGYSIGDNDPINASWGSQVLVTPSGTYTQYDRLLSALSGKVTIPNLAQGELAMLQFSREAMNISDTYTNLFAVYGVKIRWTRKTTL